VVLDLYYRENAMRRLEKEIKNIGDIEAIISRAQVCQLGMCYDNKPCIVPVNFGYKDMAFYIHSA
jgi:nitroimidazol reductase NimA-like FMN-containing flavoprotein (pyridoxamine 5'-phosphate oxidase superfamily)